MRLSGKSLIVAEIDGKGATIRRLERGTLKAIGTRCISGEWRRAAIAPNGEASPGGQGLP